jgi:diguanylate cyclase (GGDEF)-like protein/PAS domain S-box-containing protein
MTNAPLRIMLIEDDEDDYLLTRDHLRQALGAELQVDWVADFEQARSAITRRAHDVYLVDYRLGAANGLELIREASTAGCHAPFIILTGQGDRETDLEAMKQGAADYLVKGALTVEALERAIRYALARTAAETALRKSEQQQRVILNNIDEAVYLIIRGEDGQWPEGVNFISPAVKRLIGLSPDTCLADPQSLITIIYPDDVATLKPQLRARFGSKTSTTLQYRALHRESGQLLWIEDKIIPQLDEAGRPTVVIGILRDITQRKAVQDKLFHAAFHDRLTGLPNRTLFMDRLAGAMRRGKRSGNQHWAVLFIDLDKFKNINDTLGHEVGDKVLISTVRQIRACLRAGDTLARLAGDEFVALLEDISSVEDAARVADRIHQALAAPHRIDGREVFCSVSIGIAKGKPRYEHPEEVLRNADTAMYHAKAAGQARAKVFETGMHMRLEAGEQLEKELERATERDELQLYYQPIVALKTRSIAAMEALVRWQHHSRGLLHPSHFVPLAEKTGLIVPIGKWVLRAACQQMRTWKLTNARDSLVSISVNVSPRQLAQTDLVGYIDRVTQEVHLDKTSLQLEITEAAVRENGPSALLLLKELKGKGVRVSMDDFGSAQASLSNLHRLPIDVVKMDGPYIEMISRSDKHLEVVRATVELAHRLELKVVAEGVETALQAELLTALNCDFAQGFYFSPPVNASDATVMLAKPHPEWISRFAASA